MTSTSCARLHTACCVQLLFREHFEVLIIGTSAGLIFSYTGSVPVRAQFNPVSDECTLLSPAECTVHILRLYGDTVRLYLHNHTRCFCLCRALPPAQHRTACQAAFVLAGRHLLTYMYMNVCVYMYVCHHQQSSS